MNVEQNQKMITMKTILLLILMITLPTTATAQPQYVGTEPMVQSPYGNLYQPTMVSPNATQGLMNSGSKYSSTATGFDEYGSTVDGAEQHPTGPRRVNGHPDIPFPDPLGDAAWPLALLALAYVIYKVRKRVRA